MRLQIIEMKNMRILFFIIMLFLFHDLFCQRIVDRAYLKCQYEYIWLNDHPFPNEYTLEDLPFLLADLVNLSKSTR